MCERPVEAIFLSPALCVLGWIPGVVHALIARSAYNRDRRERELLMAAAKSTIAANVGK
jgi:hypothetical protein